mmetsp:Transcript_72162/g.174184  ORF Transcript_72162/g.174184 Transcript_72162/m.174184 type:complete len:366 (-) Transcript_72162:44-1141(-)
MARMCWGRTSCTRATRSAACAIASSGRCTYSRPSTTTGRIARRSCSRRCSARRATRRPTRTRLASSDRRAQSRMEGPTPPAEQPTQAARRRFWKLAPRSSRPTAAQRAVPMAARTAAQRPHRLPTAAMPHRPRLRRPCRASQRWQRRRRQQRRASQRLRGRLLSPRRPHRSAIRVAQCRRSSQLRAQRAALKAARPPPRRLPTRRCRPRHPAYPPRPLRPCPLRAAWTRPPRRGAIATPRRQLAARPTRSCLLALPRLARRWSTATCPSHPRARSWATVRPRPTPARRERPRRARRRLRCRRRRQHVRLPQWRQSQRATRLLLRGASLAKSPRDLHESYRLCPPPPHPLSVRCSCVREPIVCPVS